MSIEVKVPTLGESVTEATVATWFKQPGDDVAADEMLCELETDKVTVEVPSPSAGTLAEIVANEGDTVGVDALLATIAEGKGAAPAKNPATSADPAPAKATPNGADDAQPSGGGETIDVMVPALGESVTEATIATWFKQSGDQVAADEMLCELETDKVSVEVPAPAAGTLGEILAAEGDTVAAGGKLATMTTGDAPAAPKAVDPEPQPDAGPAEVAEAKANVEAAAKGDVEDAPSAKKLMAEKGLSSGDVQGTGRDGRVMKEDVLKAAAASPAAKAPDPAPAPRAPVPADQADREERVKMTRLRQTIARRLKDAQNTAAMLTTYTEVDMTEVMALRSEYKDLFEKKHGTRLGFMSFFTKACIHALFEVPEVNSEIDGTEIVYKNYVHMGIAA
ncbi:MAG: biotin/lipoyl-containing protein, partial [Pseudomonadota bacterium]